jgi:hypothetical protein
MVYLRDCMNSYQLSTALFGSADISPGLLHFSPFISCGNQLQSFSSRAVISFRLTHRAQAAFDGSGCRTPAHPMQESSPAGGWQITSFPNTIQDLLAFLSLHHLLSFFRQSNG